MGRPDRWDPSMYSDELGEYSEDERQWAWGVIWCVEYLQRELDL